MSRIETILSDISHAVAIERFGPSISSRVLWRGDGQSTKIALTFDDGPDPVYTPQVVEVLTEWQIPATFFLIGRHAETQQALVREMAGAGHEIANHTFTHPILWQLDDRDIAAEINRTSRLLQSIIGARPRFLRPPMGLFSRRVLDVIEQTGYRPVVGDVYPRDPHLPGADKIARRVMRRTLAGSVIILHDGGNGTHVDRSQTVAAIKVLIPELRQRGFHFVTLRELFGEVCV